MPIGDPRDGFLYPTLTLMMDSYSRLIFLHLKRRSNGWGFNSTIPTIKIEYKKYRYKYRIYIYTYFSQLDDAQRQVTLNLKQLKT